MQIEKLFIEQDYGSYTNENHSVWSMLCSRQNDVLSDLACRQFYAGLEKIGLDFDRVPKLSAINERVSPVTGWTSQAVPGYLDSRYFFECLRKRVYPTTITIRAANSVDYIEEPDIFHDVYGHVALMADKTYGDLMQAFGDIHDVVTTDQDVLEMTRLFWFTIEFGLIHEAGKLKLLGSGLLSSPGEAEYCLSDCVDRRPFRLAEIVETPFRIDCFQDVLYIAESIDQLIEAARVLLYQVKERNNIRWGHKQN